MDRLPSHLLRVFAIPFPLHVTLPPVV